MHTMNIKVAYNDTEEYKVVDKENCGMKEPESDSVDPYSTTSYSRISP